MLRIAPSSLITIVNFVFYMVLLAAEPAIGWQVNDAPAQSEATIKIYPLSYANSEETQHIISRTLEHVGRAKVTADEHTNSLIVVADAKMHATMGELITQIDVETRKPTISEIETNSQVVQLRGLKPQSIISAVAATPTNRPVNIQVVEPIGSLIVSGEPNDVRKVRQVIDRIIEFSAIGKVPNVNLSMTFVAEATQINPNERDEYREPNAQIAAVIKKSTDNGLITIDRPLVVCKTVNRVRVDQPDRQHLTNEQRAAAKPSRAFENNSESGGSDFSMRNSGTISQIGSNSFELDALIELMVNGRLQNDLRGSTDLHTKIEVPLGHPVLLSFSTILGVDSVVIVQVDKAE